MMKKKYIKPEVEELLDTRLNLLLTASQTPENSKWNAREQDVIFAEDDDDNDELF